MICVWEHWINRNPQRTSFLKASSLKNEESSQEKARDLFYRAWLQVCQYLTHDRSRNSPGRRERSRKYPSVRWSSTNLVGWKLERCSAQRLPYDNSPEGETKHPDSYRKGVLCSLWLLEEKHTQSKNKMSYRFWYAWVVLSFNTFCSTRSCK